MQVKKTTLIALLTKAGIDPNSDDWKKHTGPEAPETSDDELGGALYQGLDSKLLSLTAAKTHPEVLRDVKAAAKAEYFGQVDETTKTFLKDLGLDDAAQKAILDGKATPERVAAALAKVKELSSKTTDQQREDLWKQKEAEFTTKIGDLETKFNSEVQAREQDQTDFALTNYLGNSQNFALRSDLPNLTRYAKGEILDAIAKQGAKLVVKDGVPTLVDKADPTKPFHAPGAAVPLDLKEFTTNTLDQAGFLNKQPGRQDQQHNQQPPQPAGPPADNQAARSAAANDAAVAATLAS